MIDKKKNSKVLFISLFVNTFLLGIVLSCYVMNPGHRPPPHGPNIFAELEFAKNMLPDKSQALIESILKAQNQKLHDAQKNMHVARKEAGIVLTAQEFNAQALDALHLRMDEQNAVMRRELSKTIYDIAVALPAEERIRFFERVLPKGPPRRRP